MKQLLNKILPNFIRQILIKQKYKKQNISIHKINIKENNIVKIKCHNSDKYNLLKSMLYKSFGGIIEIEQRKFYFHPIAVIKQPNNIDEYLKLIGAKSRNMNKKAQKNGIECKEFNWNDNLDDIYNINISSQVRQGRQMDKAYQEYPQKVKDQKRDDFDIVFIGAFKDDILVGYYELYIYGNFIMTNRILGHKEYLKYGIMNLMVKYCVEYMIKNNIKYLNYLTMQNRQNNSLSAFKYRVGFREYSLLEL